MRMPARRASAGAWGSDAPKTVFSPVGWLRVKATTGALVARGAVVILGNGAGQDAVIQYDSATIAKLTSALNRYRASRVLREPEKTASEERVPPAAAGATVHASVATESGVTIGSGTVVDSEVKIGRNTAIGMGGRLHQNVALGADVVIGDNVQVDQKTEIQDMVTIESNVTIGKRVVIGAGARIRAGTVIADGTVIRAGEIVPDGTVNTFK